jgi:hypothetical protein
MKSDIKIDKEFKVLELLTGLSVTLVVYGFLYQYFFFSAIGVSWMANLLSPNLILLTSIKALIASVISVALGYGMASKYHLSDNNHLIVIGFVVLSILSGVLGEYFNQISASLQGTTSALLVIIYILTTSYLFFILFKLILRIKLAKMQGGRYKPALIFAFFLAPFLFLFIPWNIAQIEANKVTVAPSLFYNKAILNKDKTEWYLVSVSGDKALLQNSKNMKFFKYVDMKDIAEIYVQ